MQIVQLGGVILAITAMIYFAIRGYSIIFVAFVAMGIVIISNQLDINITLFVSDSSLMGYLIDFLNKYFLVFVLGSVNAGYLRSSGAIERISDEILERINRDKPLNGLIAVYIITLILTMGGISLFVVMFAVVPLARHLFDRMRIPWRLVVVPIVLGLGTITAGMMPGSPSLVNLIPTKYLSTSLTAQAVPGILASFLSAFLSIHYMHWLIRKEKMDLSGLNHEVEITEEFKEKTVLPSLTASLSPVVLLIALIVGGSALNFENYFVYSLLITVVFEAILFKKYIISQKVVVNDGISASLLPLFSTGITVAFGSVVAGLNSIRPIINGMLSITKNKLIGLSLIAMLFSVITGSGSGAVEITTRNFAFPLLQEGYKGDVLHRLIAIASLIFTNTPHCGAFLTLLGLSKLKHRETVVPMYLGVIYSTAIPFTLLMIYYLFV